MPSHNAAPLEFHFPQKSSPAKRVVTAEEQENLDLIEYDLLRERRTRRMRRSLPAAVHQQGATRE